MSEGVEFVATLSDSDWVSHLGGWNCSALALPGVEVTIVVNGAKQDQSRFDINPRLRIIRWLGDPEDRPTRDGRTIAAIVSLTKRLTTINVPVVVAIIGALATLGSAVLTATLTKGKADKTPPSITDTVKSDTTHTGTTIEPANTSGATTTTTSSTTDTGRMTLEARPFVTTQLTVKLMVTCVHRGGSKPTDCFEKTGPLPPVGAILTPPAAGQRAKAVFRVPRGARRFVAELTEYSGSSCRGGNATSYVLLDDNVVSPAYHMGVTTTQDILVPIPYGTKTLELRTEDNDNDAYCDDVMWVNARFQ